MTEDEKLNKILHDYYEKYKIPLPWKGDFNKFMSDKNNHLKYGFDKTSPQENPGPSISQAFAGSGSGGGGGGGGDPGGGPGDLASLFSKLKNIKALEFAKAHPFKTAGLIGSGMMNIGGLTDNDKIGGQLGGLALGGLAASQLATGNPYMAAMLTLGGGNIGSLFDKLRARKEQEQSYGGR